MKRSIGWAFMAFVMAVLVAPPVDAKGGAKLFKGTKYVAVIVLRSGDSGSDIKISNALPIRLNDDLVSCAVKVRRVQMDFENACGWEGGSPFIKASDFAKFLAPHASWTKDEYKQKLFDFVRDNGDAKFHVYGSKAGVFHKKEGGNYSISVQFEKEN